MLNAPHSPVPTSSATRDDAAPALTAPVTTPRTPLAITFTVNVPHGNTVSWRVCTARSVRYRTGAPTIAPRITSNQLTSSPAHQLTGPPCGRHNG